MKLLNDISRFHDLCDEQIVSGCEILHPETIPTKTKQLIVVDLLKGMQKPTFRPVYVKWPNGLYAFIQLQGELRSPTPSQLYAAFQMALASLVVDENLSEEA